MHKVYWEWGNMVFLPRIFTGGVVFEEKVGNVLTRKAECHYRNLAHLEDFRPFVESVNMSPKRRS